MEESEWLCGEECNAGPRGDGGATVSGWSICINVVCACGYGHSLMADCVSFCSNSQSSLPVSAVGETLGDHRGGVI